MNFSKHAALIWLDFFLSQILDNLTTALVICAVILAVGKDDKRFIGLGCINVVVAANAGGAFSPLGDIITLMVWQKGLVSFTTFFLLFISSVVNYVVPAAIMHFAIPDGKPLPSDEQVVLRRGARRIMLRFLATIATAVSFHNFLHLPPFLHDDGTGLPEILWLLHEEKPPETAAGSGQDGGHG